MAQRVMNAGDGNQILMGRAVQEVLGAREAYLGKLRKYLTTEKHGARIEVYQLIAQSEGLNVEIPTQFRPAAPKPPSKMSDLSAFYLALALKHADFLFARRGMGIFNYAASTWLYFLAGDAVAERESSEFDPHDPHVYGGDRLPPAKQLDYYATQDFWLLTEIDHLLRDYMLADVSECFEGVHFVFVNKDGRGRLEKEHPEILRHVMEKK
jgi:hypothetical protein